MKKNKLSFLLSIIVGMVLTFPNHISFSEPEETSVEVVNILDGITSQEKNVLEQLFILSQEIDNLTQEALEYESDIEAIKSEILSLNFKISLQTQKHDEMLVHLGEVLKHYQKNGANSYFEILIRSNNIGEFLHRLNILRDYTNSNKKLVDEIEQNKRALDDANREKRQELETLEQLEFDLSEIIKDKTKTRLVLEASLADLHTERDKYEAYLYEVNETWNALKPLFKETVAEFSRLVKSDALPYDAISLEFSITGVKGIISESVFNAILEKQAALPKLDFKFQDQIMVVSIPEKKVSLVGHFEIVEGHSLKYIVTDGSFYDLPLEPESVKELFSDGYMSLDLTYLLEGYKIDKVILKEGILELYVKPSLF